MRPLLMSSWFGHLDAVRMLIESGADPNAVEKVNLLLLFRVEFN